MITDGYNSETDETLDSNGSIDELKADLIKVRVKAKEIAQSADLQGHPDMAKHWQEKSINAMMKSYNPTYEELKKSAESIPAPELDKIKQNLNHNSLQDHNTPIYKSLIESTTFMNEVTKEPNANIDGGQLYDSHHRLKNKIIDAVESRPYDADSFSFKVHQILQEIEDMLISKNEKYGDSVLNPNQIFSKASKIEQINVRIDDKLNRIKNRTDDEDEDVDGDLIGYLVLRKIAKLK